MLFASLHIHLLAIHAAVRDRNLCKRLYLCLIVMSSVEALTSVSIVAAILNTEEKLVQRPGPVVEMFFSWKGR